MISRLRRFILRVYAFVRPGRGDRELAREIAAHLRLLEDELQRRGMSAADARAAARRRLGGVDRTMEHARDARTFRWLEDARQDVRHAAHTLVRTPWFTLAAVSTLALGIGANTAIFSVVEALLLRPLPYANAGQLVRLVEHVPAAETRDGRPRRRAGFVDGQDELAELQRRVHALSHVAAHGPAIMTLVRTQSASRLEGARVSGELFPMLGVQPELGRSFDREMDDRSGGEAVVVLSHQLWQQQFGGDPAVLGQSLRFEGLVPHTDGVRAYTIIGVMPPDFEFPDRLTTFWIPLVDASRPPVLARLADDVSIDAAEAELNGVLAALRDLPVKGEGQTISPPRFQLVRAQDALVEPVRPALLALVMAVGLVLLMACVNVAGLVSARAVARQRELAIRMSLGAGRSRVLRYLLTESVMLAMLGGVAGVFLASGGVELWRTLGTTVVRMDLGNTLQIPRLQAVTIDASVLAYSAGISLMSGLLCGIAPAIRLSKAPPLAWLRQAPGTTVAGSNVAQQRAQRVLLTVQVAMAVLLCVGGALLIGSFLNLTRVPLGYDPTGVLTFQVAQPAEQYPLPRLEAFAEAVVERLNAVPGVEAAAYAQQLPMVQLRETAWFRRTPEVPDAPAPEGPDARIVSQAYLDAMGIRVVAGRGFRARDAADSPRVVVINQALARQAFPTEEPLGAHVYAGRDAMPWEIVGIVDDVRQFGPTQAPEPQFFVDVRQWPATGPLFPVGPYYAVRTTATLSTLLPRVRGIVHDLDDHAAVYNVAPMQELVSNAVTRERLYAVLVGILGAVAIGLAAAGVAGMTAYAVARRTREIGVRVAVGATRTNILQLVLRDWVTTVIGGVVLGLVGAVALQGWLKGLLFGLTPDDPAMLLGVSLACALIALLAACGPAVRATQVDPVATLRAE